MSGGLKVFGMQKVLIIGTPNAYEEIDRELLTRYNIVPLFLYSYTNAPEVNDDLHVQVEDITLDNVKNCAIENHIDGVVCLNDNFLIETSKIRQALNLPGIHLDEMKKFKFKSTMCDELETKLDVIPYLYLDTERSYQQVCNELGDGPFFVKPDSLAGSEGAFKINNVSEYDELRLSKTTSGRVYIIQPHISGELYHCELVVCGGEVLYKQARKYSYPNFDILSGKIIASFPVMDQVLATEIEGKATCAQETLGFNNGVMHTEFFREKNGVLRFLETNIRTAGGGINLIHMQRLGVSLDTLMVILEMGRVINIKKTANTLLTSGYIPTKKGRVVGFKYPKLKGNVKFMPKVKVGDVCSYPTSASNASLVYIGQYNTMEDMLVDFNQIESCDAVLYE